MKWLSGKCLQPSRVPGLSYRPGSPQQSCARRGPCWGAAVLPGHCHRAETGSPRPERTGGGVEHGEVVASKREDDPKPLCLEPNPVRKQGRAVPDLLLEMHSHRQNHIQPRCALTSARLSFGRKYTAPKQRLLLGRRWWWQGLHFMLRLLHCMRFYLTWFTFFSTRAKKEVLLGSSGLRQRHSQGRRGEQGAGKGAPPRRVSGLPLRPRRQRGSVSLAGAAAHLQI